MREYIRICYTVLFGNGASSVSRHDDWQSQLVGTFRPDLIIQEYESDTEVVSHGDAEVDVESSRRRAIQSM